MAANLMKYRVPFVFILLNVVMLSAWGQVLSDPTRPPLGIGDAAPASAQAAYPKVRGLQSVIVSAQHCAAIIDGKTVALGAMHGNERLVEVNQRGVVLQGERGRRVLTLFPAVGVTMTQALSPENPAARCQWNQLKNNKNPAKQAGQKERK